MNTGKKAWRSKAYSNGGLWICAPLWRTSELTDTEKCLVALIDGLTKLKHPCEVTDKELARVMMLTRARTDAMLKSLEERRYVLRLWLVRDFVCRVVHPNVSSKPATVRKWIKAYCSTSGWGRGGERAFFATPFCRWLCRRNMGQGPNHSPGSNRRGHRSRGPGSALGIKPKKSRRKKDEPEPEKVLDEGVTDKRAMIFEEDLRPA